MNDDRPLTFWERWPVLTAVLLAPVLLLLGLLAAVECLVVGRHIEEDAVPRPPSPRAG